jgi:adenylylsulfate kinase-like enzyme
MIAKIVWLTGLSGSGKSTILKKLYRILKNRKLRVKKIDGDFFRLKNKNENSFTENNIVKNNISVIKYIKKIKKDYDIIIVALISPFQKIRKFAKKTFNNNYYEIYVHCSINTLKKRDTKGLYYKADKGLIHNLIGYNSSIIYQKSLYSVVNINTDTKSVSESVSVICKKIFYEI